tara:strand:+ start:4729 stop:5271 length:543 start_codon:yes stop_codon:yes gene_type:complete
MLIGKMGFRLESHFLFNLIFIEMERFEIINELKNYFKIYELVGPFAFKIHGERAFKFFSTDSLNMLLITRKGINRSITVNNWYFGGKFSQRGLRSNLQNLFRQMFLSRKLYLSGHVLGEAFDFDVFGMDAVSVRNWIIENQHLYPFKIRLENLKNGVPISWVHMDAIQEEKNPKVYLFNV